MRLWLMVATVIALTAGGRATASAQEGSEGAENFVRAVYASYSNDPDATPPMVGRSPDVWSDRMSALIARDQELANGDLPYLDADPICNCQDWEDLTVQHVRIYQDRTGRYGSRMARVEFTNAGTPTTVILSLDGNPNQGWKIDDIVSEDGYPSLAEALAESNRLIEAGGRALGRD